MTIVNKYKRRFRWVPSALLTVALGTGYTVRSADGEQVRASDDSKPNATTETEAKPENASSAADRFSPGIHEIIRLAEAGVSAQIIKAFIERSSVAYEPTATELITLKQRGVPDEVTAALLKRGAELKPTRQSTHSTQKNVVAPAIVRDLSTSGRLDPESYEFWLYHYAYPRALSQSYRTLATPYYNYPRQGYGVSRHGTYRFPDAYPGRRYR